MTADPESGPPLVRKGMRHVLLLLAGLAAPLVTLALVLWFSSWQYLEGQEPLALLLGAEVVLGIVAIALVARRQARWFAVPCAIVCAGIALICCSCWALFK